MITNEEFETLQDLYEKLSLSQQEKFLQNNGLFGVYGTDPLMVAEDEDETGETSYTSLKDITKEHLREVVDKIQKKYEKEEIYIVIPVTGNTVKSRYLGTHSEYKKIMDVGYGDGIILINEENEERAIELLKQKIQDGFCNSDTWNLDETISRALLPKLFERYRDTTHGYPGSLHSFEEWEVILGKIIWYLNESVNNYWHMDTVNMSEEEREQRQKEYIENCEEASQLLGQYFADLWD